MAGIKGIRRIAVMVTGIRAGLVLAGSAMAALVAGSVLHKRECDGDKGAASCERDRGMESGRYFDDVMNGLAATLGMSEAELEGRLADGGDIMEIAAGKDVTLDDLVDSMVMVTEMTLESEVEKGYLSSETADRITEDIAEFFAWNLERGGGWLRREHAWRH